MAFGFAGVCGWPTYTTAGVVPYGLLLALVFVVPVGIIKAMTGIEVTLNVLAEFIGGMWVEGNALAMNYFKSFGYDFDSSRKCYNANCLSRYVTCAHAIQFASDLKLAHYLKVLNSNNPSLYYIAKLEIKFGAPYAECFTQLLTKF